MLPDKILISGMCVINSYVPDVSHLLWQKMLPAINI